MCTSLEVDTILQVSPPRQDDKEVSPFLSVNAGSSSNLSTYRPNTAQSARSNNPAVLSSPHTSPAHLRPRTSQHRPASGGFGGGGAIKANHAHHIDFHKSNAHRTGRAGLKDFSSAKTANGKCQVWSDCWGTNLITLTVFDGTCSFK